MVEARAEPASSSVPTTLVQRGDVTFTITARGEIQGTQSVMLTAPMTGAAEAVITSLREAGELVKTGDIVVEFDTTDVAFDLREAEADLAEAQQKLEQSKAESLAREEEARFALLKAESELKLAELECRRNELVAAIVARQNDLAASAARDRLEQLEADLASRKATSEAGVAIQEAALRKAQVKMETAQRTIAAMTLRAPREGYVSLQQNQNSGFFMWGMQLPIFQVGDTARPGMGVAQVLDLGDWELTARLAELDRGHLAVGQEARVQIAGVPEREYHGRVKTIGNTTGPPWERRFECKLAIEDPTTDLRPGMSAEIKIQTEALHEVLWVPSQALFDRDGQKFVYRWADGKFSQANVDLVRSGESRAVVDGLQENDVLALSDPTKASGAAVASTASQALSAP
jgi:multidrug efflux pump subunit AcrA (membrane-fusion protein)